MTKTTNILLGTLVIVLWVVFNHVFVKNIFQLRPFYAGIGAMLVGFLVPLAPLVFWHEHLKKKYSHIRYICHHCSSVFKPAFYQFPSPYMIKHNFNKYLVKCPQCGKKDYMEFIKDELSRHPRHLAREINK